MKNMFIYGSLKKGLFNHSLISENPMNKLIRKGFILGYKLYILYSYPGVKKSLTKDKVFVELYNLTDEVFDKIDGMERRANYIPVEVEDDCGKRGVIYVYNGEFKEENCIPLGNWTKNHEKLKFLGNEKLNIEGIQNAK